MYGKGSFHSKRDENNRNKRKSGRIDVNILGTYIMSGQRTKCEIINISESGALVKVPQFFTEGDELELEFEIAETKETFRSLAIVRYMRNNKIGVQFKNLTQRDKNTLENFVKKGSANLLRKFSSNLRHFDDMRGGRRR